MMRKFNPPMAVLAAGLLFLYAPLVVVMIYSFNASKLVTVWTGFSVQWYAELLSDDRIRDAALNSVIVACASATLATAFGTLAGYVLARFGAFRTRTALFGVLAAPLVMPEIMIGLSLLLLFVGAQQLFPWMPARGLTTIVIAHASLTFAYVAVIVQARLAGMDRAAEEAAADLGAPPHAVFFFITLPMIAPAVAVGWLLAFVLSLDDLVIASFVSGPQSTTLPMVVFSSIRLGVSPKINALATLLIAVTLVLLAAAAWFGREGMKMRSK